MDFNQDTSNYQSSMELLPAKTIVKGVVNIKGLKNSTATNGRYADCELIITEGPYERRKLFFMIPDISDTRNSEAWIKMGKGQLARMGEAGGIFVPSRPETYSRFSQSHDPFIDFCTVLVNTQQVVRVGIQKGQDGYGDKNTISEWASSNPKSEDGFKLWNLYHNPPAKKADGPVQPGFLGAPQPQPQQASAPTVFGSPVPSSPQGGGGGGSQGFTQPQQASGGGAPAWMTQAPR